MASENEGCRPDRVGAVLEYYMNTKKITLILSQQRNKRRVNIHIDGQYAFSLHQMVAAEAGLRTGLIISEEDILNLQERDTFVVAQNKAYTFLSYRPRSEAEVRKRLLRAGSSEEDIDKVTANLKRLELLDDEAFAKYWSEQYGARRRRGKAMVKAELRRKGIDKEIAEKAVEDMDEYEIAYAAGAKKVKSLKYTDQREFRRKLGAYLLGRGFNYESINTVVRNLWDETNKDVEE